MCSCGITFGVSAIASMTSSVNSAGCGEVNRTRSSPSISPQARSSLENACRSPNSTPYALTFCPSRVTSLTPSATSASISARMSPGRRSFSLPRSDGTMQNVQVLLQPTEIDTQAAYADSRLVGSVEGNTSSDSRISTCASSCDPGPLQQHRQRADVVGAEHDVDPRRLLGDRRAVLLRQAAADGDLHAGVLRLHRREVAEVAVELVVGVLAHRAGVEDDDVGLLAGRGRRRSPRPPAAR